MVVTWWIVGFLCSEMGPLVVADFVMYSVSPTMSAVVYLYCNQDVEKTNPTPRNKSCIVATLLFVLVECSYFYYSDNAISYTEYIMGYNIMGLQGHSKTCNICCISSIVYCCPDCPSCLTHLNSIVWATLAILAAVKKYSQCSSELYYRFLNVCDLSSQRWQIPVHFKEVCCIMTPELRTSITVNNHVCSWPFYSAVVPKKCEYWMPLVGVRIRTFYQTLQ